jgi:superfamily II DNA/RNA helicase
VTVRVGDRMRIPSGLQHRVIVVPSEGDKVAAMCRAMRGDLRGQSADAAPARVIVFAGSEGQARRLADPLRTVLWGDHKMSGGPRRLLGLHAVTIRLTSTDV